MLKDHPYRKLALKLRRSSLSSTPSPRVVGLTASYTYAVGEAKVTASLRSMCHELLIKKAETATPQELKASGYHTVGAAAEVLLTPTATASSPHPLESSSQPPCAPRFLVAGVVPEADRKPHEMGITFFRRERDGGGTVFACGLMACVRAMERAVVEWSEIPSFTSPLPPDGKLAAREWGAYAHKLACNGGTPNNIGERECHTFMQGGSVAANYVTSNRGRASRYSSSNRPPPATHRPMVAELEHWYEAVKALVVSWEQAEDSAATILDMAGYGRHRRFPLEVWPDNVRQAVSSFWGEVPETFPRFEHLKEVLMDKYKSHGGDGSGGGTPFRGIIFVTQRVTTHVLAHIISKDPALAPLFSTACLYASSSPATASLSVSRAKAQNHLLCFRGGQVNLLLATVVAEEGMDIPAANCVIRFDALLHAVSLVQGRGRARQEGSSFVVLDERADRPLDFLEGVEQQQLRLVRNFKPATACDATAANAAALAAQRSRECGARSVLLKVGPKAGTATGLSPVRSSTNSGAVSAVNMFSSKTKVVLEETWAKGKGGLWECTLAYQSPLRELHAAGLAPGKKVAKKLAAAKLVADLLEVVPA